MLNISGINDIDNIIYDYKKQIEQYELVYKCIVDHLTPCIPTKNFNNLSLDELLDTFTTKIRQIDLDMIGLCRDQKTLIGSFYGSISPHESFRQIIKHYLKGEIDIRSLVERTYKLEQINDAFYDLENGLDGRGIIIYPN